MLQDFKSVLDHFTTLRSKGLITCISMSTNCFTQKWGGFQTFFGQWGRPPPQKKKFPHAPMLPCIDVMEYALENIVFSPTYCL